MEIFVPPTRDRDRKFANLQISQIIWWSWYRKIVVCYHHAKQVVLLLYYLCKKGNIISKLRRATSCHGKRPHMFNVTAIYSVQSGAWCISLFILTYVLPAHQLKRKAGNSWYVPNWKCVDQEGWNCKVDYKTEGVYRRGKKSWQIARLLSNLCQKSLSARNAWCVSRKVWRVRFLSERNGWCFSSERFLSERKVSYSVLHAALLWHCSDIQDWSFLPPSAFLSARKLSC